MPGSWKVLEVREILMHTYNLCVYIHVILITDRYVNLDMDGFVDIDRHE